MSIKTLIFLALADSLNYFKPKFRTYKELYVFLDKRSKSSVRDKVNELFYEGAIEKIIKNGTTYLSLTQSGWNSFSQNFLAPLVGLKTPWDKKWRIVTFDIAESDRKRRDNLRSLLRDSKFGRLSNSLYISVWPFRPHLSRLGKVRPEGIFTFEARTLDNKQIADLAFNLDNLAKIYKDWIKKATLRQHPVDALIAYYDIILRTDPGLPKELLPVGWPFLISWRIFIGLIEKKRIMSTK